MVLSDLTLKEYGTDIIEPFCPQQVREVDGKKVVSWGLSSYGYDIRLGDKFLELADKASRHCDASPVGILDVHDVLLNEEFVEAAPVELAGGNVIMLAPHQFVLGVSYEKVKVPEDCIGICMGKSTYARLGIVVNTTPLEPGWEGHVTMEFSNTTDAFVPLYVGEGVAQILFIRGDRHPGVTYKDRHGKYQNQPGSPVVARV